MKPFLTALILAASCAAAACSPGAAQTSTPAQSTPSRNETPRDGSQLQDVGTPAGPHMLGPLSQQPSQLPPNDVVIRLDPNATGLDPCRPRDTSKEPKREPGPINANGALTFFGLPVAVTPEDLKAGKVEVALIGAPIDMGVGFRGAGEGSTAFRATRGGGGSMFLNPRQMRNG